MSSCKEMNLSIDLKLALREKGLNISDTPDFPTGHVAYPNGYMVLKPASIGGNSIPGYESWFDNDAGEEELCDAPTVNIFFQNEKWYSEVSEGLGGIAPGDFKREFGSEKEMIEFIIKYFFDETDEFKARVNS
jgi:hypothetical protein